MAARQGDRHHAKDQINVRLDPDLIGRLRDENQRQGRTITDIIEAGVAAELDRLNGIATSAVTAEVVSPPPKRTRKARADTVPAATFRQPEAPATPAAAGSEPESASDMAAFFRRRNGGQQ